MKLEVVLSHFEKAFCVSRRISSQFFVSSQISSYLSYLTCHVWRGSALLDGTEKSCFVV
jgi:hypothetical protein